MKTHKLWALSAAACLAVGCANQQGTGAAVGAGAGALAGSALTHGNAGGAIVGGILGALVGSEVGRRMDERDQQRLAQSFETAPTNQPTQWVNPDTGNSYSVTPLRTYQQASGSPCREFRMFGDVGTRQQEVYGTACRQPDGSWRIINTRPADGFAQEQPFYQEQAPFPY
jgi:surface antigen